jgi:LSD1 subclass zinc finger protein
METDDPPAMRQMRLRYAGTCTICAADLPARTLAIYDRGAKTVRCLDCDPTGHLASPVVVDVREGSPPPVAKAGLEEASNPAEPAAGGKAGASARREYERRKALREDRVRTAHPKLGGLLLAVFDDPQSTRAWDQGAIGEERLGHRLDSLIDEGVAILHDRRIPKTRANIDHIAVTSNGVWVIDAKRYKGRPTLRVDGGIMRPRVERLLVGRRDCTKLVDGVAKQMVVVAEALAAEGLSAPVKGALAFVDAAWPLVGGSFTIRGLQVLWPKRLAKMLAEPGEEVSDVTAIHKALACRFPPA